MKHTDGPWIHRKDYDGVWHIDSEDGDEWIAKTVPMRDLFTKDTEADARLIAASPDLLEQLVIARDALSIWLPKDLISRLDPIDAAIAKATGEGA